MMGNPGAAQLKQETYLQLAYNEIRTALGGYLPSSSSTV